MTKKKTQADYPQFKVGELLEWGSQAHGNWRTKIGMIIKAIPAGLHPSDFLDQDELWKIDGPGQRRNHESYIVAIPHADKPTEFFWPKVGVLAKAKRYFPTVLEKRKETKGTFKPVK